jgi:FkbM family methyltransferase
MRNYIDIGCNVLGGYNHLNRLEDFSNFEKLIFVEPNPECWEFLETNLPIKSKLLRNALSTKVEEVELITRADQLACVGATILGQEYYDFNLHKHNLHVDKYNKYKITTTTLENILVECDIIPEHTLLKIDAEGVEYDVLEDVINKQLRFGKIYCEFHIQKNVDIERKADIIRKMNKLGTTLVEWY